MQPHFPEYSDDISLLPCLINDGELLMGGSVEKYENIYLFFFD